MKAELRAGAEIELLTKDELAEVMRAHAKAIASSLRRRPTSRHLSDAQTADAAGNLVLDLGAPPAGFDWDVRRIMVNGENPITAVAGSGLIVIGAPGQSSATALNVADFLPAAVGFPNVAFYSREQLIVGFPAHLLIVCAGVPAGTRLFANAGGLERDSRQEQTPEAVFAANGKADDA